MRQDSPLSAARLMALGRTLSEIRRRSHADLRKLQVEQGVISLEMLNALADCYGIFGEALPRTDITFAYYISVTDAVVQVRRVWMSKPGIDEATREIALNQLSELDPSVE